MQESTYYIWNLMISSFTAIGTIGAVVVSLHLARKRNSVKIKATVGKRVIIPNATGYPPELLYFEIFNRSDRQIKITGMSWLVGKEKIGTNLMLTLNSEISRQQYPLYIDPGENMSLATPWDQHQNKGELEYLCNEDFQNNINKSKVVLRIYHTLSDEPVVVKPSQEVIDAFKVP